MVYYLVFAGQLVCFVCNILILADMERSSLYFKTSGLLFILTAFLMLFAIFTGQRATRANCLTILLFMINLTLLVLYMFTGFLGSFIQGAQ